MKNLAYIKEALNLIFIMGRVILRGASPAETSSDIEEIGDPVVE
jgi:hypothetical protein